MFKITALPEVNRVSSAEFVASAPLSPKKVRFSPSVAVFDGTSQETLQLIPLAGPDIPLEIMDQPHERIVFSAPEKQHIAIPYSRQKKVIIGITSAISGGCGISAYFNPVVGLAFGGLSIATGALFLFFIHLSESADIINKLYQSLIINIKKPMIRILDNNEPALKKMLCWLQKNGWLSNYHLSLVGMIPSEDDP